MNDLISFKNILNEDIDLTKFMSDEQVGRVKNAREYLEKLADLIQGEGEKGSDTPWASTKGNFVFRPAELTIWSGFKGHGKALCLDTDIPTLDGWKVMGEIVPGDVVFDENGIQCKVVAVTDVMNDRPCYKVVFSDGMEIIADENHQWLTENSNTRGSIDRQSRRQPSTINDQRHKCLKPSIVTTGEIANTLKAYIGTKAETLNHAVRVCGPVRYSETDQSIPIDPYVFGAWLGDGSSAGGMFTCAYNDNELLEHIRACGVVVNERKSSNNNTGLFSLNVGMQGKKGTGMTSVLRGMGVINNKHIPLSYMRASVDARLALLQGLMDTDGSATKYGRCEFSNTNIVLAEQVFELICSLGIKAVVIKTRAMLYGKDCGECHRITFTTKTPVFRLTRKLDRQMSGNRNGTNERRFIVSCDKTDSVPVRCIQVDSPSNMYLATRAFIPTHNSLVISQVLELFISKGENVFIISPEFPAHRVLHRMMMQSLGTHNMRVETALDWVGAVEDHLWLYDQQSSLKPLDVVALCRYAIQELGVRHILIDSLMKCGLAPDDYAGQKRFVDALQNVAHCNEVHIHLVAHARKGNDDGKMAGLHDISGSADIANIAENIIFVWRNKQKELGGGKIEEPDCMVKIEAQRNGSGWIGVLPLYFTKANFTFREG